MARNASHPPTPVLPAFPGEVSRRPTAHNMRNVTAAKAGIHPESLLLETVLPVPLQKHRMRPVVRTTLSHKKTRQGLRRRVLSFGTPRRLKRSDVTSAA